MVNDDEAGHDLKISHPQASLRRSGCFSDWQGLGFMTSKKKILLIVVFGRKRFVFRLSFFGFLHCLFSFPFFVHLPPHLIYTCIFFNIFHVLALWLTRVNTTGTSRCYCWSNVLVGRMSLRDLFIEYTVPVARSWPGIRDRIVCTPYCRWDPSHNDPRRCLEWFDQVSSNLENVLKTDEDVWSQCSIPSHAPAPIGSLSCVGTYLDTTS